MAPCDFFEKGQDFWQFVSFAVKNLEKGLSSIQKPAANSEPSLRTEANVLSEDKQIRAALDDLICTEN